MAKMLKHTRSYRKGHPNPQKFRNDYELLNGEWKFVFDPENEGLEKEYEKNFPSDFLKIIVPFPYQSPASGINLPDKQCDVIWYERNFDIKDTNKTHLINFGAVDYISTIFINGNYVTKHEGGYDSFVVDVTPYIKKGKNKLTLRIEDELSIEQIRGKQRWRKNSFTCFYTETSGIVRDVYIESLDNTYIKNFSFNADYDSKTLTVKSCASEAALLTIEISDIDGNPIIEKIFSIDKETNINSITLDNIIGWSHENPYLYNVSLILSKDGKETDHVLSYCGFTSIRTENKRFFINGKDTYLKFVLDQGYWKDTMTSPTEKEIIDDVKFTLDCGFNGARMHEHVPSALNFYYMDLYGLYAWQEHPSASAYSYNSYRQYFKQYPRLIDEHISHPCIMAYVLFNESWGVNEICESEEIAQMTVDMYQLTKDMVGNRLVISNDGWEHTVSDVITFHNYSETYNELQGLFNEGLKSILNGGNSYAVDGYKKIFCKGYQYDNQPLMFSEFAGIAFSKDDGSGWGYGKSVKTEQDYLDRYHEMLRFIKDHPEIRGFCMTQLTDVYQEKNGIYTMERKEKISSAKLKAAHDKFI